jgi:hypothetical protein
VGAKNNGKTGLLAVHHELLELNRRTHELQVELIKVTDRRKELEAVLLSATPGKPPTGKERVRKSPRRRPKVTAAEAVAGVLKTAKGAPVTVTAIREKLPDVSAGAIHNALSVLRVRGHARHMGPSKWASRAPN